MAPPANMNQIGGTHYKTPIEHWDYVIANDIPYLEAQIIKYLTRWRKKDGVQDLRKSQHFLQKLFETEGLSWSETLADSGVPGPRYVNQDPDQASPTRRQVPAHTAEKEI